MPHVVSELALAHEGELAPPGETPPAGSAAAPGPAAGQGGVGTDAQMCDAAAEAHPELDPGTDVARTDDPGTDDARPDANMVAEHGSSEPLDPSDPAERHSSVPESHVVSLWSQRVPAIRTAVAERKNDLTTGALLTRARDPAQAHDLSDQDRALLECWRLEEEILDLAAERRRCSPPELHAAARRDQDSALVRLLCALDQSAPVGYTCPPRPAASPDGARQSPAPAGPDNHHE